MRISLPKILLHLEGLFVFVAALMTFYYLEGNWILFIVLILLPDLGMLGYLINNKIGSWSYNALHTYIAPLALIGFGLLYSMDLLVEISIIWIVHIGADRALGFGLKYPSGFKDTHLGRR